jgi:hypothetical protein
VAYFYAARAPRSRGALWPSFAPALIDADQIIIASAGPHSGGGLPAITYTAGGLEDAHIRKTVCDILEGGETAFRERARRLRVRLDR